MLLFHAAAADVRINGAAIHATESKEVDSAVIAWATADKSVDRLVGADSLVRCYEVSSALQPFNELTVMFRSPTSVTGEFPLVAAWLQIDEMRGIT
jgi:hypothetical protein